MANIDCVKINDFSFSENLLKRSASFENEVDYVINSGSGLVETEPIGVYSSNPFVLKGKNSLKVVNTDYNNTDLVFSSPGGLDSFSTTTPENYFLSIYVMNNAGTINTRLKLEVFQDGTPTNNYFFPLNSDTLPNVWEWARIGQNISFDSGYEYTFKWTLEKEAGNASNSKTIFIDGLAVQCLNQNDYDAPPYREPKSIVLKTTQSIDVPSISNGGYETITVTLDGARVGDFVAMTYPSELIMLGLIVGHPVVTANDQVKVLIHNHSGGSINPAVGAYTFKINR